MTTNTKIVWRLNEKPTSQSLRELVKDKILSVDEAREILFSSQTEEDRDKKSLESEIKFLRELVEKLSQNNNTKIIEVITEVEKPWKQYPWYQPYWQYCNSQNKILDTNSGVSYKTTQLAQDSTSNFSNIKTF